MISPTHNNTAGSGKQRLGRNNTAASGAVASASSTLETRQDQQAAATSSTAGEQQKHNWLQPAAPENLEHETQIAS